MREYKGGCHCGALEIIYRTNIDPMYWRLRHDGCSFCRRHGVVGTSDPAGNLSVDIEDPSKVRHYRFAHRTADFLICGECGVFVAAITDAAQGRRAVINARVLDGVSLDWSSIIDVHFDAENPLQRADRRSLHWTPVLEVSGGHPVGLEDLGELAADLSQALQAAEAPAGQTVIAALRPSANR